MKSQVKLLQCVLQDAGRACGTSTAKDFEYILRRFAKEGDSFLTITLPTFEKGLLQSLERGYIGADLFPGFHRGKGGFPTFLSGFLRQIFSDDGTLAPFSTDVSVAIQSVRQIAGFLGKYEADCSPKRVKSAFRQYKEVDASLDEIPRKQLEDLYQASRLIRPLFYEVERRLYEWLIQPSHGPGAVAERLQQNQKFSSNTWTDRLEAVFPAYNTLCVNARDYMLSPIRYLAPEHEPPVRVIAVPKTMKTPRIIAIEPTWMQYVQHGIEAVFSETISSRPFRRFRDAFGWLDQTPNRNLARRGQDGFATLDLSEASDRVHLDLVRTILRDNPFLLECLEACRSTRAELLDGEVITLKKFASMGSALCFPIETLVFSSIVLLAFQCSRPKALQRSDQVFRSFRVYGDDIIVPTDIVPSLLGLLQAFGLKVNTHKSFWNGLFRESCGADWYGNTSVSYVKCRHPLPESRQHGLQILQAVDLHNRLFESGYEESCSYVANQLKKLGFAYYAPAGSAVTAMYTHEEDRWTIRYNDRLQRIEYKGLKVRNQFRLDPLDSYGALRKCLRHQGKPMDLNHLERAGRSLHVAIHVGWMAS